VRRRTCAGLLANCRRAFWQRPPSFLFFGAPKSTLVKGIGEVLGVGGYLAALRLCTSTYIERGETGRERDRIGRWPAWLNCCSHSRIREPVEGRPFREFDNGTSLPLGSLECSHRGPDPENRSRKNSWDTQNRDCVFIELFVKSGRLSSG